MPPSLTVTVQPVQGEPYSLDGTLFMCVADSVAFERHFHVPSIEIQNRRRAHPLNGDTSPLPNVPDEWMMFFVWRLAQRSQPATSFEDFIENTATIEFVASAAEDDGAERVDPTTVGSPAESQPPPSPQDSPSSN